MPDILVNILINVLVSITTGTFIGIYVGLVMFNFCVFAETKRNVETLLEQLLADVSSDNNFECEKEISIAQHKIMHSSARFHSIGHVEASEKMTDIYRSMSGYIETLKEKADASPQKKYLTFLKWLNNAQVLPVNLCALLTIPLYRSKPSVLSHK